jgi:two-component sensor histidine kinase
MFLRILHIDDDFSLATLLKRKLSRLNHEVVHYENPDAAIEILQEQQFDVIVLDHYLENTTGHQVLTRMRDLNIEIPVVYITGSNEARVAIDAIKAGASDYVIKSIDDDFFDLLTDTILQTVENARMKREKEQAEREIVRAKERAETLLAEMNHRVANSLALVGGLLRLQSNASDNEQVRQALKETQGRIAAIAGMHRSLYTTDHVDSVEMDRYLAALVKDIANTVGTEHPSVQLLVDADPIELPADRAVSVGMIVTELATNALKYAYPDGTKGEIRACFKRFDENRAVLSVADDGVGMGGASRNPTSTGLGQKIVKSMADAIGSGLGYPDSERGMTIEIMVDLEYTAPKN